MCNSCKKVMRKKIPKGTVIDVYKKPKPTGINPELEEFKASRPRAPILSNYMRNLPKGTVIDVYKKPKPTGINPELDELLSSRPRPLLGNINENPNTRTLPLKKTDKGRELDNLLKPMKKLSL